MQDSLSMAGGSDIDKRTFTDREPPIEYIIADINGKQCSFFLSADDFKDAKIQSGDCAILFYLGKPQQFPGES